MKIKQLLVTLLLLAGLQFTANAQFKLGPGVGYGLDIEEIALQLRGVYTISGPWRAAADFDFYLDGEENISFWELNLNGQYVFLDNDKLRAYGLAGLNYLHVKVDSEIPGFDASGSETGLNIGAGLELPIGAMDFFAETRFALGGSEQLFLSAGVLFPIGGGN